METPSGRAVLAELGRLVVAEWSRNTARPKFGGDVARMPAYVNHYLAATRDDFPLVTVDNFESARVIAEAKRSPVRAWDGNLSACKPKLVGGMYFNREVSLKRTPDSTDAWVSRRAGGREPGI